MLPLLAYCLPTVSIIPSALQDANNLSPNSSYYGVFLSRRVNIQQRIHTLIKGRRHGYLSKGRLAKLLGDDPHPRHD